MIFGRDGISESDQMRNEMMKKAEAMMNMLKSPEGVNNIMNAIEERKTKSYDLFVKAREEGTPVLVKEAIVELGEHYKAKFSLSDTEDTLLKVADDYLTSDRNRKVLDEQYGDGFAVYIAQEIKKYYGVN